MYNSGDMGFHLVRKIYINAARDILQIHPTDVKRMDFISHIQGKKKRKCLVDSLKDGFNC